MISRSGRGASVIAALDSVDRARSKPSFALSPTGQAIVSGQVVPDRGAGSGRHARGRIASLCASSRASHRRVTVEARIVRHSGSRFTAAPLAQHLTYLKRDGVTRDGNDAELFGSGDEPIDGGAFAEGCADDRHHFRFIVSPEDAAELADVSDLHPRTDDRYGKGSRHWSRLGRGRPLEHRQSPHPHFGARRADDGRDLVIDRSYISEGMRARAEQRVKLELGVRTERDIDRTLSREVQADRWTSLDRRLRAIGDDLGGVIDLRPDPHRFANPTNQHLIGRASKLERLGWLTGYPWMLAAEACA